MSDDSSSDVGLQIPSLRPFAYRGCAPRYINSHIAQCTASVRQSRQYRLLIFEHSHSSRQLRPVRTTYDVRTCTEAVEYRSYGPPAHRTICSRCSVQTALRLPLSNPSVAASQSAVATVFGRHQSSSDTTQSCQGALAFVGRTPPSAHVRRLATCPSSPNHLAIVVRRLPAATKANASTSLRY
ncbi:hypothetical protein L226DRAFT_269775 [Lentinus tigrinus ALCF2SS1-7]|uniref:uncharacterized protein n=1 Tax=Lentinus tigrinus ALCF2SS1-7 TaxID=1328758 RepID=UPI001165EE75|nr:hypothetical protein L226DRAFT_269775 [Lentinus tigrinus ALCF2SS1-7]